MLHCLLLLELLHFNPRSPHGERPDNRRIIIGIPNFNPRSPHGERRAKRMTSVIATTRFQSTLPARGATKLSLGSISRSRFQSTLPARGATAVLHNVELDVLIISIHAPRTGSDSFKILAVHVCADFNPRSPHGERPFTCSTFISPS